MWHAGEAESGARRSTITAHHRKRTHPMKIRIHLVAAVFLAAGGHAHAQTQPENRDPFEGANRAILNFNLKVDRFVLKPVAKTYARLPRPVRNGVGNFFSNLWVPNTVINDLLQGKWAHAGRDSGRFAINTILGLGGLMDVATHLDLPKRNEDFGQTLAVWGVPSGPYLVLPLLGPSSPRDFIGTIPQYAATDPVHALDSPERWYASSLRLVDGRARRLGAADVLNLQPDKYLFLREGYRQLRTHAIYDGKPPAGLDDDDLLEELLQEEGEN